MSETKQKILVILGPTAVGKSDIAVKLAKKYNGEVISADSRQIYTGLDIGTGKITKKEMRGVPHYMLDVTTPKKTYTVAQWKKQTEKVIKEILSRNKLPIICGGTGFYIQSVVDNIVLPEVLPNHKLRKELETKTNEELVSILKQQDPERLKDIDTKNNVRLIRAIEIAQELGKVPLLQKNNTKYDILQIGLHLDKETLQSKIEKRVLSRIKKGMLKEAVDLHKNGLSFKRMESLGLEYRLLSMLVQNKISKADFIAKLNTEINQYAKRQMTWFKKDGRIKWFEVNNMKNIEKSINEFIFDK